MHIDKVLNNKRLILAVLGVTKEEFLSLLETFEQVVLQDAKSKKRKRAVGGGSNGKIKQARIKLFFILFYAKTYPTFDVAAFMFASSKSRTHHWAHKILPLLEKTLGRKIALPKRQIRTPEEFLAAFPGIKEAMTDGVERPTQRSKKNKKLSDKALAVVRLPKEVALLADTGFVGIDKQHSNTLMPKKKPRGGELTADEKAMNRHRLVSIGGMKRFLCVSEIFRNKKGWDDKLVFVCAGLWNFHIQTT